MTTPEAFLDLFFVSRETIGRGLPGRSDKRTGKMLAGPWRDTRKTDAGSETSDRPISTEMIARHIDGTLLQDGSPAMLMPYIVSMDGQAVLTVVDIDVASKGHADLPQHFDTVEEAMAAIRTLCEIIAGLGLRAWFETTKGGSKRVWIFHHRLPAADARDLGLLLLKRAGLHQAIEIFPKQAISSITGSGVFLPYYGGAAPGRQVITDPNTGETLTSDAFAAAALAARSTPEQVHAIVQAARDSGEITITRTPGPRREQAEGSEGQDGGVNFTLWKTQTENCSWLSKLIETAESRQELAYDHWLRLAGHLRTFGNAGRKEFHRLSEFDSRYDPVETDHKFDSLTGGSPRCDTTPCGKDPYVDCGLPEGKVSSAHWAYRGMALTMAVERESRITGASKSAGNDHMSAGTDSTPIDAKSIPAPANRSAQGVPEYAPYQLTRLLDLRSDKINPDDPKTHTALACRAVRELGDDLRYCPELGWLQWDGRRWKRHGKNVNPITTLFVALSKTIRAESTTLYAMAAALSAAGRSEDAAAMGRAALAHQNHVRQVESGPFAAVAVALTESSFAVEPALFEPKPWVIGFQNGVWDHGQWREHRRDDYMLELCPVEVDMSGKNTGEWQAVLDRITGGDTEYTRTLQDVAGYALSGASNLRKLPWAYGGKGTGKSTFAELLMTVLGGGAASVDTALLTSQSERAKLGAVLWGKRLAVCPEAGHSRIDAELLKTYSGGDRYSVKFHYQQEFTASPTHVLFMTANDAPSMNAYDDALQDRLMALPFNHPLDNPGLPPLKFADGDRIESVRRNINAPLVREFAAWALAGATRVQQTSKIHECAAVMAATNGFWQDTDPLTPFWEQVVEQVGEQTLRNGIPRTALYTAYTTWCTAEGLRHPLGSQKFYRACETAGLLKVKNGVERLKLLGTWQYGAQSVNEGAHGEAQTQTVEADFDPAEADSSDFDPIHGQNGQFQPLFSQNPYERERFIGDFMENGLETARSARCDPQTPPFLAWLKSVGPTRGSDCQQKLRDLGFEPVSGVKQVLDELLATDAIRWVAEVHGYAAVV